MVDADSLTDSIRYLIPREKVGAFLCDHIAGGGS